MELFLCIVIYHQRLARLLIHHLGSIGLVVLPIAKPLLECGSAYLHPLAVGQFGFAVSLSLAIGFLPAVFLRRFVKLLLLIRQRAAVFLLACIQAARSFLRPINLPQ